MREHKPTESSGHVSRYDGHRPAEARPNSGENLERFRSVASRSIPGLDRSALGGWDRVAVTGATGCVGTEVVKLLEEAGVRRVLGISSRDPAKAHTVPGVEYTVGQITDRDALRDAFVRFEPDLVIHLAAIRDPGRAERHVLEAVRTNVVGTRAVVDAASAARVPACVAASTGKAMRLFTSDVYASTKQMIEYLVGRAQANSDMVTGAARFTHLVDNSLIVNKLFRWARAGQPIELHGLDVYFAIQSAREAAELLLATAQMARDSSSSWTTAIRDLGWPPISLLDLARDVVEETHSSSPIICVGFPPGYEESLYPGTLDPRTAGDHSPLFNAFESDRAQTVTGFPPSIDLTPTMSPSPLVDDALRQLDRAIPSGEPATVHRLLSVACLANLRTRLDGADPAVVRGIAARGERRELHTKDHRLTHDVVMQHVRVELEEAGDVPLSSGSVPLGDV